MLEPGGLSKILRDEFYAARVDGAKGQHKGIVDADLWDRLAAMLRAGKRERGTRSGRPPPANHLFRRGFLRSGRCGGAMVPRSRDDGEGTYRCYTACKTQAPAISPRYPAGRSTRRSSST